MKTKTYKILLKHVWKMKTIIKYSLSKNMKVNLTIIEKKTRRSERIYQQKISELPIHQLVQRLSLGDLMWDFDCVNLYPSAMWDENGIYPKIETGYVFTEDMIDELVEKFNNQTLTQGSAILKGKY